MFAELVGQLDDVAFVTFGEPATIAPVGGGPSIPATVIVDRDVQVFPGGEGAGVAERATLIHARKSEYATPKRDDQITLTGSAEVFDVEHEDRDDGSVVTVVVRGQ